MSEEIKQEVKEEAPEEVKTAVEVTETEEEVAAPEAATEEANGSKTENGSTDEPSKYAESESYKKLIELKVKPAVADILCEVYESGLLSPEDIDERAVDIINSVSVDQVKFIFKEIKESELFGVNAKSLYVTSLFRSFKDRCRQQGAIAVTSGKLINGPELATIKKLLEDTGYNMEVTIGQRKIAGPPPGWEGPATGPVGQGHEIYVGHIPTDIFEDTLFPLFEKSGKIWDLRLMMDPLTGASRGYAFVTYCSKETAAEAAKTYDGHEISTGKPLKVNVSIANTRLFLGNIPKTKSKDEILEELKTHAEGVTDVIVYSVPDNEKVRNRGFCFVDFIDHKTASDIKRKIAQHKIRPFNADVYVDWAEHQEEPDEDTMSKVKVLYIRNIKEATTEEKLTELFKEYASLDRVKKVKDYAFIHFNERDDCLKAMEQWNGKELDGTVVEASLAKPPQEKKKKPTMRGRGFSGQQGYGNQGRGGNRGGYGNGMGQPGGFYNQQYGGYNNGYDMPMPWGGGYGGDMGYGGYGGAYGGPGAYGDFGYGGGYGGGFRGGNRGGFRGGPPGRGGMPTRRGRGKRPGDGRGGPASKRDNGQPDFSADVNMSTF